VIAASAQGPLHLDLGIGCQDRIACRFSDEVVAIAVSDGLGSASLADVGAEIAVKGAVGAVSGDIAFDQLPFEMVRAARASLEGAAADRAVEMSDLACTLIVAVAKVDRLNVGHIGDGAVVAETFEGLVLASPPAESEYANEVDHLAGELWEQNLRLGDEVPGVTAFAVFSDGCQRAALSRSVEVFRPHPGFFEPLFQWARDVPDFVSSSEELRRVLTGEKLTEHSEDDKTLALAIIGGHGSL
jgi:hypothetical protein